MCTGNSILQNDNVKSSNTSLCKGQQIIQVDGNDSDIDSSEFESSHSDTDDEVDN